LLKMSTLPLARKQLLSNRTMTTNFPVFILKPWCARAHTHTHTQSPQWRSKYERQNSKGRQTFVKES
jgi:hypothetical protein